MNVRQRIKRKVGIRRVGAPSDWLKTARVLVRRNVYIPAYWCREDNWGDRLSPVLIRAISGREPVHIAELTAFGGLARYSAVGSILGHSGIGGSEVWGAGFLSAKSVFKSEPARIHAVRGPLSREIAVRQGVPCPQVFGDPALLCPRFLPASRSRRYALGIVPHYNDRSEPAVRQLATHEGVTVIDVGLPIDTFVERICECSAVASSSLHGLIAADAYGVPSVWLNVSGNVLGSGFKFRDYFASVGRPPRPAVHLSSETSVQYLLDHLWDGSIDIDLDALWDACPFRA